MTTANTSEAWCEIINIPGTCFLGPSSVAITAAQDVPPPPVIIARLIEGFTLLVHVFYDHHTVPGIYYKNITYVRQTDMHTCTAGTKTMNHTAYASCITAAAASQKPPPPPPTRLLLYAQFPIARARVTESSLEIA